MFRKIGGVGKCVTAGIQFGEKVVKRFFVQISRFDASGEQPINERFSSVRIVNDDGELIESDCRFCRNRRNRKTVFVSENRRQCFSILLTPPREVVCPFP